MAPPKVAYEIKLKYPNVKSKKCLSKSLNKNDIFKLVNEPQFLKFESKNQQDVNEKKTRRQSKQSQSIGPQKFKIAEKELKVGQMSSDVAKTPNIQYKFCIAEYKCRYCNQGCLNSSALVKHEKSHFKKEYCAPKIYNKSRSSSSLPISTLSALFNKRQTGNKEIHTENEEGTAKFTSSTILPKVSPPALLGKPKITEKKIPLEFISSPLDEYGEIHTGKDESPPKFTLSTRLPKVSTPGMLVKPKITEEDPLKLTSSPLDEYEEYEELDTEYEEIHTENVESPPKLIPTTRFVKNSPPKITEKENPVVLTTLQKNYTENEESPPKFTTTTRFLEDSPPKNTEEEDPLELTTSSLHEYEEYEKIDTENEESPPKFTSLALIEKVKIASAPLNKYEKNPPKFISSTKPTIISSIVIKKPQITKKDSPPESILSTLNEHDETHTENDERPKFRTSALLEKLLMKKKLRALQFESSHVSKNVFNSDVINKTKIKLKAKSLQFTSSALDKPGETHNQKEESHSDLSLPRVMLEHDYIKKGERAKSSSSLLVEHEKTNTNKEESNLQCHKCGNLEFLNKSCTKCSENVDTVQCLQKSYNCKECDKQLKSSYLWRLHMIKEHNTGYPYVCTYCNKGFLKASVLHEHKIFKHNSDAPYKCNICDKVFVYKVKLQRHLVGHSEARPYSCDKCPQKFKLLYYLKNHQYLHKDVEQVYVVNGQTVNPDRLKNHSRTFKCNECDKELPSRHSLETHKVEEHNAEFQHKCPICNKGFFKKPTMMEHYFNHTGEKQFRCDICDKECVSAVKLKSHSIAHSDARPYQCEFCPKDFKRRHELNKHSICVHDKKIIFTNEKYMKTGSLKDRFKFKF